MGRCIREDCRYRATEERAEYGCDYAEKTGRTRLGQIYRRYGFTGPGRAAAFFADPARCPFYEKEEEEA